jgi:RNA polymerase sigma factor (TIGR02999 family)
MSSERTEHTLQHTALVHEAYLRLVQMEVPWSDRAHFFAVAARAMRRILVDHAKTKKRTKRGGNIQIVTEAEVMAQTPQHPLDILALDRALDRLEAQNARQSETLQLRYFGGMTSEEIAEVLKVSVNTVDRDLKFAREWVVRELRG